MRYQAVPAVDEIFRYLLMQEPEIRAVQCGEPETRAWAQERGHADHAPCVNPTTHPNIIVLVTDHDETRAHHQVCRASYNSSTKGTSMFSVLLNAAKLVMPSAAGPAVIVVPTLLYVIACRKFEIDLNFSFR